jgi:hypothetical protein
MLCREVLRVADADDLLAWVMTEQPGWEGDRGRDRLQVARRQGDDQAFDLTGSAEAQIMGHDLEMPVVPELIGRANGGEYLLGKSSKVLAQGSGKRPLNLSVAGRGKDLVGIWLGHRSSLALSVEESGAVSGRQRR